MLQSVPIKSLVLAPENPRKEVSGETLRGLGESIRPVGALQNLVAHREGERYLVVGEGRRLGAGSAFAGRGHSPGLPGARPGGVQGRSPRGRREGLSPAEELEAVAGLVVGPTTTRWPWW